MQEVIRAVVATTGILLVRKLAIVMTVVFVLCGASTTLAEEAQWIWSPAYEKDAVPAGACYFRKTFNVGTPESGEIQIACDDSYELFVNERKVGTGQNWKVLDSYNITSYLLPGFNTVAVKSVNSSAGAAGLVARVIVKQQGNTHVTYSTDSTWKTSLKEFQQWRKSKFNDNQWLAARSFGNLGSTLPWGNEPTSAGMDGRFRVMREFRVEWVVDAKQTGSLIAMTFDEFGQIVASRENGPLLLIRDDDHDGLLDSVTTFCDEIKNCQGLLAVSGRIFAIGQGPQGAALYRLSDDDQDGKVDQVEAILKFTGEMGEHGPHALVLGPDGLIYIVVGNFSRAEKTYEPSSPYRHPYEGDLVTPRYEDASGHAAGIKAPGGTILRTDTAGSGVELFAGGLQNPYDIAFNEEGELLTADSDMEWDAGMPWYRPTRLNHVVPGAEFGWRSGWAKWPDYYIDSLPPLAEMGRGSPTGIEVYNHYMYPQRYHNAAFVCDWSRGRILAVRAKANGASYKATTEVFLEGQPLNVTDLAVAPDGWLYFCTGGRDTEGGIYRVIWEGKVPPEVLDRGHGLAAALRQPQLSSAWARQKVAMLKQNLGAEWESGLTDVVEKTGAPVQHRVRALDLMQLFGPYPSKTLLVKASHDRQTALRIKAAYLMGIHANETTKRRLIEMLGDTEQSVQRAACESLVRAGQTAPPEKLMPLLATPDRYLAWAACRALEQIPRDQWQTTVLTAAQPRVFLNGVIPLLIDDPAPATVDAVLTRGRLFMLGYMNESDNLDLLRVFQLALLHGKLAGDDVPLLRKALSEEYPAHDARINRELVRLLTYLQEPTAAERFVQQLKSDLPDPERMHVAMHVRFLNAGWTAPLKLEVLRFYEHARTLPGGHSFGGYIENVSRDFFASLNEEERQVVLAEGAKWPSSALSVLAKLPDPPSVETLAQLQVLDRRVAQLDTDAAKRLRIGIAAVLGHSKDPASMKYLRELYENEPDRRVTITVALAQDPTGENWPLLVRSLSIVEGAAAQEVLAKLARVDRKPDKPEPYRQVIVRGLMLRDSGAYDAVSLLEKWTGEKHSLPDDSWQVALKKWQQWYVQKYPDEPDPKLFADAGQNNWTFQELFSFLTGPQGSKGDPIRGALIFEKAQCIKCHRFGKRGDSVGPDLTTVRQRFQRKEILESILFPSQVISDQYATQTVVTSDGRALTGMVAPVGDGSLVVLLPNGHKVNVPKAQIEQAKRSKTSSMPDGLLNVLTLEEIADLFAYLTARPEQPEVARQPGTTRR